MPKLIVTMWVTLDGFVSGLDDSMEWLRPNAEMMEYETNLVEDAGALLLGRHTHADFASYWPAVATGDIDSDAGSVAYARRLDQLDKVVASRSGRLATWPYSRQLPEITSTAIEQLKATAKAPIVVYGSLGVVEALNRWHLIDELHLLVHPVLLGEGKPLVGPAASPTILELIECRPFSSGVVLMKYRGVTGKPGDPWLSPVVNAAVDQEG